MTYSFVHSLVGDSNRRKDASAAWYLAKLKIVILDRFQALVLLLPTNVLESIERRQRKPCGILTGSFFIRADKGDMLTASYVHHVDHLKSAGVAEISRRFSTNENTFTVGASYAIDPMTVMKMRLNNYGKLGALLQHELKPKSTLTISGEFDTKALDKNPRFGLALALKP